jgi:hypothetical protein
LEDHSKRILTVKYDTKWNAMYAKLSAFVLENKNCNVPSHYKKDVGLGHWVSRQRWRKKNGTIREDRKNELEKLNFVWDREHLQVVSAPPPPTPPLQVPNASNSAPNITSVTPMLGAPALVRYVPNPNPPISAPRPKNKAGRCFRCGNRRDGPDHAGGTKSNSEAFCTILKDQYYENWVTVAGYGVGDERSKLGRKAVVRWWKGVRQEHKLHRDPEFEGW